jgi:hypothetical protein
VRCFRLTSLVEFDHPQLQNCCLILRIKRPNYNFARGLTWRSMLKYSSNRLTKCTKLCDVVVHCLLYCYVMLSWKHQNLCYVMECVDSDMLCYTYWY